MQESFYQYSKIEGHNFNVTSKFLNFEVIVDSHAVVRNHRNSVCLPWFPSVVTSCKTVYSKVWAPYWHWFTHYVQISHFTCPCVCVYGSFHFYHRYIPISTTTVKTFYHCKDPWCYSLRINATLVCSPFL